MPDLEPPLAPGGKHAVIRRPAPFRLRAAIDLAAQ
jgi:hypothetical protein